ncbi:hypothetical protein [Streptomyces sp. NBC_00083]|uniref:hypothetical protein n=1 Tax=Streptomyces sp. NBC_00083 TaxID=2975647 RepID=UPI00225C0534|nr:hypothetical protein [Streptomyces sp. NBC_00083]MCX5383714.1 hypothetical protein [Streptomyces sp. NBC_00083]
MTTVAALAVCGCASGCVSVEAGPAPSAPLAPSSGARSRVFPEFAQPPAREALDTMEPTASPATQRPEPPESTAPTGRPEAVHHGRHHGGDVPRHRPAAPAERHPRPAPAPPVSGDVCALGQGYGGWRDDSPEARICHQVYGH